VVVEHQIGFTGTVPGKLAVVIAAATVVPALHVDKGLPRVGLGPVVVPGSVVVPVNLGSVGDGLCILHVSTVAGNVEPGPFDPT